MNKQIEEMAKELCGMNIACKDCRLDKVCLARNSADILYKAGYRKQSEGYWIVHTHHYECSNCGFVYETDVFCEDYNPITDFYLSFCSVCGAKMRKEDEGK